MKEGVASIEDIGKRIIKAGAFEVRNVDAGAPPFVYSTGNRGPGYLDIKGLVGQRKTLKFLTNQLAYKVSPLYGIAFDFVEGNATGGMIPAWQLTDDIERHLEFEPGTIPYTYLRESRKEGGHGEHITGNRNNPLIQKGMRALICEELVNFAGTTTNAAEEFRASGYPVSHGACIFSYDNPQANTSLADKSMTEISLITLPQFLDVAEQQTDFAQEQAPFLPQYREFIRDPIGYQLKRDWVVPEGTARRAMDRGLKMRELIPSEALALGAPPEKLKSDDNQRGFNYWAQVK